MPVGNLHSQRQQQADCDCINCSLIWHCCFQAMVLVSGQIPNLADPVLTADPLFGVTGMFCPSVLVHPYSTATIHSHRHYINMLHVAWTVVALLLILVHGILCLC